MRRSNFKPNLALVVFTLAFNVATNIIYPDLFIAIMATIACSVMVGAFLWLYRRPQQPAVLINTHDWRAMRQAARQLARRRPWMWGPLAKLWVLEWHLMEPPYAVGPIYRWKTRRDREIERDLNQCCGVPKGQKCPSHGGRHA